MNVAYYSPMPPTPTGVADYSASLVDALTPLVPLSLNRGPADIALYHIGNNALHREIYARAISHPGVAVIHDAVLQHFFLGTLSEAAYVDEFTYNYGSWSRSLAIELYRQRARSGADARFFAYPMLRRIAEVSRAIIVHNPAAAAIVRAHAPRATVAEIPHLFSPPLDIPDPVSTLRLRHALHCPPNILLVGALGYQRETKRLGPLLRAFHRAYREAPNLRLLLSTRFVSTDLEKSLKPWLEHPAVLKVPYLGDRDFWRYAAALDVCCNLRYPSAAETSGVAIRLMGLGKTVMFTRSDAIARLPDDACLRIDVGPAEEDMLANYLVWLAAHREAAAQIGARAKAHIAREHALSRVAALYVDAIRTAKEASSPSQSKSVPPAPPTDLSASGGASAPEEFR